MKTLCAVSLLLLCGCSKPAPKPLIITTESKLPDAIARVPYAVTFSATGGEPPYSWAIAPEGDPAQFLPLGSDGVFRTTLYDWEKPAKIFVLKVSDARENWVSSKVVYIPIQSASAVTSGVNSPIIQGNQGAVTINGQEKP